MDVSKLRLFVPIDSNSPRYLSMGVNWGSDSTYVIVFSVKFFVVLLLLVCDRPHLQVVFLVGPRQGQSKKVISHADIKRTFYKRLKCFCTFSPYSGFQVFFW